MDNALAKRIGDAAREARTSRDMTQEDAAERAGISVEFYGRIERGGTLPSAPTIVRLAAGLGVSADVLLGLTGHRTRASAIEPGDMREPPPLRRLLRRIRRSTPAVVRAAGLIVAELERLERTDGPQRRKTRRPKASSPNRSAQRRR